MIPSGFAHMYFYALDKMAKIIFRKPTESDKVIHFYSYDLIRWFKLRYPI